VNSYIEFLQAKTENYTLEQSTQPTLSRLPAQNTKIYSSQLERHNKWTTVSNKQGRPTQEEAPRAAELVKESDHWLNPTSTQTAIQPCWKMKAKTISILLILGKHKTPSRST
jgi:hypothetical protein